MVRLLTYLEKEWGKTVANNLLIEIDRRIEILSQQPFPCKHIDEAKDVKSILLTKHNRVYYRIKGNSIEVINLYDSRLDPKKNIFNR